MKKSATEIGEQDFSVKWSKFIYSYQSSKPRMTETSINTPVHVAYLPIASMNHQWTINLHDGNPPLHVLLPEEYIPPSLPTLCNLKSTMFHFAVDLLYSTTEPQYDLPSLVSPNGEMASSFSWTSFFKSPTSSTLCFGDSTLAKLYQVKLLCKTEFCITKFYFVWYTQQLIGADTSFYVPRSSSCTHQVSDCHSYLVTTPSSSIDLTSQSVSHLSLPFLCIILLILDKLKIEMTKDPFHHAGKNGEHFYGENLHNAAKNGEHSCVENFHGDNLNPHNINKLSCTHQNLQESQDLCHPEHCLSFVGPEHQASKIYEYLTWRHIKSNQHMDSPNTFSNYVKTTLKHGLSLSEVDLADLKRQTTKHGPESWKLTGEEKLSPTTHQVDACSCKLTGEENSESTI